jgi:hypothetical protein
LALGGTAEEDVKPPRSGRGSVDVRRETRTCPSRVQSELKRVETLIMELREEVIGGCWGTGVVPRAVG